MVNFGMNLNDYTDTSLLDIDLDELKKARYYEIRANLASYIAGAQQTRSMNSVSHITSRGLKAVWGLTAGSLDAATWVDYRVAVLAAAAWAEANGVDEFQLGNELDGKVDGITLTVEQLRENLKSLATEVKAIYKRGKVSYSTFYYNEWIAAGKGDIDIISLNVYKGTVLGMGYKTQINLLIDAFGLDGFNITEFSISAITLDTYSTDEKAQAAGVLEMIEYIKSKDVKDAYFFSSRDDRWGYKKLSGQHRKIWDVLKTANGYYEGSAGQANIRGLSHG
jgi:hypothetical protein